MTAHLYSWNVPCILFTGVCSSPLSTDNSISIMVASCFTWNWEISCFVMEGNHLTWINFFAMIATNLKSQVSQEWRNEPVLLCVFLHGTNPSHQQLGGDCTRLQWEQDKIKTLFDDLVSRVEEIAATEDQTSEVIMVLWQHLLWIRSYFNWAVYTFTWVA